METASIREKLAALSTKPVALEALWDGDTQGWKLTLFAVMSKGDAEYQSVPLFTFDEPGGDFRLFVNEVPPWPELEKAALVGDELSTELGVPFHFPARRWPEDECPHWWEVASSYPCDSCGMALLQREPCPWRGRCYHCHRDAEHAAKEALLTPEERARPRCHVCGKPATQAVRSKPRCDDCILKYEDYECSSCSEWTMILRSIPHTERCSRCELIETLRRLTPRERQTIIDAGRAGTFAGIDAAKKVLRCSLGEAVMSVHLLLNDEV